MALAPSPSPDGMAAAPSSEVAAAVTEVEEQMGVLAAHVRANLRDAAAAIDPTLSPFGLKVLRLLLRNGPTHASAVAEQLFVDRSAISRQVRQLEDLGLVEMTTDPDDGRARYLALTEPARQKIEAVVPGGKSALRQRLSAWSADDLRQFSGYIARLNDAGD